MFTDFYQQCNQWYRYLRFNFNIILLSTYLTSVHHPFGTFFMLFLEDDVSLWYACRKLICTDFLVETSVFMTLVLQWRPWGTKTFFLGSTMLQSIFLQKILVHCAHCNSFKSRQSPTNHDSLKAGNLILQRNFHHHKWLMSSYLYNPITFLFAVQGRAASHLCNQVLPYIIITILMLEFHCVILFIKLWLY
jgi:hypothetical protein